MLRPSKPKTPLQTQNLHAIRETRHAETNDCIARRMDSRPQAPARQGERADPSARRAERRASHAADGGDREGIRIRGAGRAPHTRRLFGKRSQLIVYHFMFGLPPDWEDEGCPSCSYVVDNLSGGLVHLAARDTAFAAVSRAPFAKIKPFKQRMGWTFPWLSSFGTDFNEDFGVTLDKTHTVYNYAPVSAQPEARPHEGEREGL